jgi:hypothetical protein
MRRLAISIVWGLNRRLRSSSLNAVASIFT